MERQDSAVAVVVDREFGDRLVPLAERLPVWVGTSETNRPVVQAIWARHQGRPSNDGVTLINADADLDGEGLLLSQWGTINEHHPSWAVMEVYGAARTPLLTGALQEFGVTHFEDRADGFVASRPEPVPAEQTEGIYEKPKRPPRLARPRPRGRRGAQRAAAPDLAVLRLRRAELHVHEGRPETAVRTGHVG